MRFIGSKRLLLKNIDYAIQQNIKGHNRLKSFCDIFSGTTIVSQYFKNKYQIISNDLLYFSYCLQKSHIELNKKPKFINLNIATNLEQYLNNIDATKKGLDDRLYLHRSLVPLERIEFADQQELFMCEEGFCGL